MRRSGGTSALLQKVNAQLRGERVPVSKPAQDDDDGVGAYLSSLGSKTKKPQGDIDWSKLAEMSDVSVEEEDEPKPAVTTSSDFLKKKKPTPAAQSKDLKKPKVSKAAPTKSKATGQVGAASKSKSSALNKAAAFTAKYAQSASRDKFGLSDSDLDLDISMDEDVLADAQKFKGLRSSAVKPSSKKPAVKKSFSSDLSDDSELAALKRGAMFRKRASVYGLSSSDEDDSMGFGKGGDRFLKKTPVKKPTPDPSPAQEEKRPESKRGSRFQLPSAQKYSTRVTLDSDEESMAEYLENLSPTEIPGRSPRAKSPPSARKQAFLKARLSPDDVPPASPDPMHDISEEKPSPAASSAEEDFHFNVMDLDELESPSPVVPSTAKIREDEKKEAKKKKKTEKTDKTKTTKKKDKKNDTPDIFSEMGLYTVDDLLGNIDDLKEVESDASEVKEQSETIATEYETGAAKSGQPLRSILSPSPKPGTPKSSRSRVRLSLGDLEEIRSRSESPEVISTARPVSSRQYSDDFDETTEPAASIKTDGEDSEVETVATESRTPSPVRSRRGSGYSERRRSSEYSEDFTVSEADSAATATTTRTSRRSSRSSTRSTSRDSATYSDDYTSYTASSSRTSSPDRAQKAGRSVEIQTEADPGLLYHWNLDGRAPYAALGSQYGLGYVDPAPIATHTISADALEALTSYSPSVLALNDMLRQQLQLTTQFVDSHKRLHQAYVRNLEPNYMYTTLEDTKNYIKKNRKQVLTFDEALKQVKEEMSLENS